MKISPGIRFLVRNLLPPVACIFFARGVANATFGFTVSTLAALGLSAAGLLVLAAGKVATTTLYYHLQAKAAGARLAPTVKGKWPGNVDVLKNLLQGLKFGYLGDGLYEMTDVYGPVFNLRLLWSDAILTACPKHMQTFLATDFHNYVKGDRFRLNMQSVLGDGVFNSDGEMWSFHRTMTRPYFVRDRVRHFEIFDRHSEKMISLIKSRLREGFPIDFQDLVSRFTMDSATEFLFGTCVDSLSAHLPYPYYHSSSKRLQAQDFPTAFSEVMLQIALRERLGWVWPLFELLEDRTAKPMKTVNAFVDPIISKAVERKRRSGKEAGADVGDNDTLLDELLNSTTDHKLLRDQTLNILLAGRDTTMHTLTITIYFLAMYPPVAARLRDEIMAVVGPSERPSYEHIKDMKYLRAVINETLRLYPPVETVKATTWPSPDPNEKPIYIPAGMKIWYSVMIMQRRADLWGPDADQFDPDRFLDERVQKYLVQNPWQFLPFNGGPRICLGQQFAYNEMSFVLVRLLQAFVSVSLDLEAWPPHMRVPPEWAGQRGRKSVEQIRPQAHVTMYTMVCGLFRLVARFNSFAWVGRVVGQDDGSVGSGICAFSCSGLKPV
ncbi:cytochrome P450 monooxygenase pc-1 [Mycena pura]|uniref:Cytochrome P450 monooxygenase pc-1 n=1 Tax=Mycena pura TaxID=153505 RepID=A0AAD6VQN1_9AGAR|nr:cytochrome P450 monooxygenase pc-1 [Mycena pura]